MENCERDGNTRPPDMPPEKSVCESRSYRIRYGNATPPTCLMRNQYVGQEATVRTGHGTTDLFNIGKGEHQSCI